MTLAEVQADLAALRAARQRILTGQQATTVALPDGSRVEYQFARLGDLNAEISRLEALEVSLGGAVTNGPTGNRPILPIF